MEKEISFQNDILPMKEKFFRVALRITLDRAEAEDIVQETLIRIWNKKEEWNLLSSIEAYGMTVCKNLALDRHDRSAANSLQLDDAVQAPLETVTPQERLEQKEHLRLVQQLMDQLPEIQQQVMELREIEGKTYREISQILSLTEEQVKVNLFRARQKVKKQYLDIEKYGL